MRNFLVKTAMSFFGTGYLPFMPGTFASAAGLILYYFLKDSLYLYIAIVLVLLILGLSLGSAAEKVFRRKDPPQVVIDEVAGILISLAFLPVSAWLVFMGFVLFRILDTLKPFPAGRLQEWHGGIGIMVDDIVAGVYANIILQIVARLASCKIS